MKSRIILKTVTLISVLVSCGFSVIGIVRPELLVSPALGHNSTLVVLASYAAARSIAIAAVCIFTLFGKKREPLYTIAVLAALVQFFDVFVGIYEGDISKAAGPLILAFLGSISIYYVFKSPDTVHNA
ncbi:MAG TPA: hypothetical protein VNS58_19845 [Puia sp.]|nr:hypothetical protein [Puia sp.]